MNFDKNNRDLKKHQARGKRGAMKGATPETIMRERGMYDLNTQRWKFRIDRSRVE